MSKEAPHNFMDRQTYQGGHASRSKEAPHNLTDRQHVREQQAAPPERQVYAHRPHLIGRQLLNRLDVITPRDSGGTSSMLKEDTHNVYDPVTEHNAGIPHNDDRTCPITKISPSKGRHGAVCPFTISVNEEPSPKLYPTSNNVTTCLGQPPPLKNVPSTPKAGNSVSEGHPNNQQIPLVDTWLLFKGVDIMNPVNHREPPTDSTPTFDDASDSPITPKTGIGTNGDEMETASWNALVRIEAFSDLSYSRIIFCPIQTPREVPILTFPTKKLSKNDGLEPSEKHPQEFPKTSPYLIFPTKTPQHQ